MSLEHIIEGFREEGVKGVRPFKCKRKPLRSFSRRVICSDLYFGIFHSVFTVQNIFRAEIPNMRSTPKKSIDRIQGVHYLGWEKITWPSPLQK